MRSPKVSVGLAVYNGENFLAQAIESVLNQTLPDLELIVTDNASTDRTSEICKTYAALDSRVIYHRNATNIGAVRNETLAFSMCRGKYFRWLGHDDVCGRELLAECVAVLEGDPSIVLCQSAVVEFDGTGTPLGRVDLCDVSSPKPHERFRNVTKTEHNCEDFYAVMRADVLRTIKTMGIYTDSDRALLAELALHGRFHRLNKELSFRRVHAKKSTVLFTTRRDRMIWYDPKYKTKLAFPFWMQFADYLTRVSRVRMSIGDKIRCYRCMIGWLRRENGWWMIEELGAAVQKVASRAFLWLTSFSRPPYARSG
jgi:glycosyltransferase involved in cell wall biosynthesis